MSSDISKVFSLYLPQIEAEMEELVQEPSRELAPFYGMMQYHLGWVDGEFRPSRQDMGKRLRPVLCLLSCQASGGSPEQALPAAAALELLHNFSQIHDDIEDGDAERRHRATLWKLWGVPQALNAGDGMMSLVYLALLKLGEKEVEAENIARVMGTFSRMYRELCEGQYLDLAFEGRSRVALEEYLAMIRRKTAALIAASVQIGAMLATKDEQTIRAMHRFGENLGLSFQIVDDILGIWGDPATTGKPVANDLRRRKKTLPIVYAQEAGGLLAEELCQLYTQEALEEPEVQRARELLERTGAKEHSQGQAAAFHTAALEALEEADLPDRQAKSELKALADFLLHRQY